MNAKRVWAIAAVGLLLLGGCSDWRYDVTEGGVAFEKVRIDASGFAVGRIESDAVVAGRPCAAGWLRLHPGGAPAGFTASADFEAGMLRVPAGTWVVQDSGGTVTTCAFPDDTMIQGYSCRGTGGPKGVQTTFYHTGALKQFFPVQAVTIDGVPCAAGLVSGWIELHGNGRLKSCRLAHDQSRGGRTLRRGTRIEFTDDGRIAE